MRAAILAIGNEIVSGLVPDTNSGFLAERLLAAGVEPVATFAVPDDDVAIHRALERALEDAEVVISTGGLGPTDDDITTEVVARLTGRELTLDEGSLAAIEARFRARGMTMSSNNYKQALFPDGSTVIPNPAGTAPGLICQVGRGSAVRHVVCLPGVPAEMRRMAVETVIPWLEGFAPSRRFASRVFSTVGITESQLGELLGGVVAPQEAHLAFRAAFPRVQASLTISGSGEDPLEERLDSLELRVRERLGQHLYAVGDLGMEEVVGELLQARGLTLALAESCTGGLIGHRITSVPGSSAYFLLGVVTYSNEAKERQLGVRHATLQRFGAVSPETAAEMAEGARRAARASVGLATTGIAGPGGATEGKPVGTVCIGLARKDGALWSHRYDLGDRGRDWIKEMTAQLALDRLRIHLLGERGER